MKRLAYVFLFVAIIAAVIYLAKAKTKAAPVTPVAATPTPAKIVKSFSDVTCADAYLKLFAQPILDIRMIFGYKDARPARFVDDRYEEMIFIEHILDYCSDSREDCGFERATKNIASDENVFIKNIQGPDGETKLVKLTVLHSSVGPDDDDNRKNPFQKWQSETTRKAFLEALKLADVVFYNGHSRSGGGPDFAPPLTDAHGHVKYNLYKAKATNLQAMQTAMRSSRDSNLQMVGLFSCASEQLFTQKLDRAKPGVGVISSKQLLYFSDALENSLLSLSAVLSMKCKNDFSTLYATSTELNGFWNDEPRAVEKTKGRLSKRPSSKSKKRTKGRGPKYLHQDQ